MKELFEYLEALMADPSRWQLEQESVKHEIESLVNRFADHRQPTLDQLILALRDEYPALVNNKEILDIGIKLRSDIISSVFVKREERQEEGDGDEDDDDDLDEKDLISDEFGVISEKLMKFYENKMILFERLLSLNNTLSSQLNLIGAEGTVSKRGRSKKVDEPGTAQYLLTQKGKHKP